MFKGVIVLNNRLCQWLKRLRINGVISKNAVIHKDAVIVNCQSREKLVIGEGTHVRANIFVYPYGEGIHIGDDCYIGEKTIIRSGAKIDIGNSVLIAHNCNIIDTDSHEINYKERDLSYKNMLKYGHPKQAGNVKTSPIVIKDHAWLSYNVSILKGVTIGKGAIIGACSVITHDIPDFCVAVGNPAKVVKYLNN